MVELTTVAKSYIQIKVEEYLKGEKSVLFPDQLQEFAESCVCDEELLKANQFVHEGVGLYEGTTDFIPVNGNIPRDENGFECLFVVGNTIHKGRFYTEDSFGRKDLFEATDGGSYKAEQVHLYANVPNILK